MGPFKVVIARFPGNNSENPQSSGWVMKALKRMHKDERISEVRNWFLSDTPITMCRNRAVKDALAMNADYLLMIDNDMQPDYDPAAPKWWPTAWEFMMRLRELEDRLRSERSAAGLDDVDVAAFAKYPPATIAAPYCGPPPGEPVYVFGWKSHETAGADISFTLEMIGREDAAFRTGIQEVGALPTGLILYDMRVFKKLPPPWFEYEWADPPFNTWKGTTEDVFQTRNASLLGMPQFVTWDCWAAHLKTKRVVKPRPLLPGNMRREFADAILRDRAIRVDPAEKTN